MSTAWPPLSYSSWPETCDTLHAHTQVLGKLGATLGPPEPQLQHAALRLTARGWESHPLPAPDRSGAFVAGLDLHSHQALIEHSDGREIRIDLAPHRSVAEVTREILEALGRLVGEVTIDPTPQEVPWTVPLDEDEQHSTYETDQVERYFVAATQAALVLSEFKASYRGRGTPVNAWWGSFDLAVSLFSGLPADPPADDFIMRNSMDAQEVAIGWWPGDASRDQAAFYAYAHPRPDGFADADLAPQQARWDSELGEFLLEWSDIRGEADPHELALEFCRSAFQHACDVCGWDSGLAASARGVPPAVR